MPRPISLALLTCGVLLLCLAPNFVFAGAAVQNQSSAADVQRELKETLQAIASYSAEQRDVAIVKAKEALAKTDARIDQLQQQLDRNLQPMSNEARQQAQETLNALRRQRSEIAEWYGGLKHSSSSAWDEIKAGFAKSYTELVDSLEKARDKF